MIIKGNPGGNVKFWADHLQRDDTNTRAELKEVRGLLSEHLRDALQEMRGVAAGSRSHGNFMYQANINPGENEVLTEAQWQQAFDTLEKNLGLDGHQRIVVEHEKNGRVHRHAIWNRVDAETLKVTDMGGNWRVHEQTSRQLEKAFDLTPTPTPTPGADRRQSPEMWEIRAAEKSGIKPENVTADLTALWQQADNGQAFQAAIEERGYTLAKGDRRDFCVIDQEGTTHSLARRLDGVKAAAVREKMADVDRDSLPTVADARAEVEKTRAAAYLEKKPLDKWEIRAADRAGSQPWQAEIEFTELWKQADSGKAFQAALEVRGFILAKGDRRDFCVIDHAGDVHNLVRRLDGVKAAGMREKMADVDRDSLPTVEEAVKAQYAKQAPPPELGKAAGEIRLLWQTSKSGDGLAATLDANGMTLARVTAAEALESHKAHAFAKAVGNYAPRYDEGEIVIVNSFGGVHKLTERTTGDSAAGIQKQLGGIDHAALLNVADARAAMREAARIEFFEARQAERPLTPMETKIQTLQRDAVSGGSFSAALYREGITLAHADAQGIEALAAEQRAAFLDNKMLYTPDLKEGELVAVNRYGGVHRLNPYKLDLEGLETVLTGGQKTIPTLGDARDQIALDLAADKAERDKASHDRQEAKAARETKAQTTWQEKAASTRTQGPTPTPSAALKPALKVVSSASKPVESLMNFLSGLGGRAKPANQAEEIKAQRRAIAALENIAASMARGDRLNASDISNLTQTQIDNLKLRGDDAMREMIENMEKRRARERERDWGREQER